MSEDGRTLAVAEPNLQIDGVVNAGAVLVYQRSGDSWTRTACLQQDSPTADSVFGLSAALSADGSTLVVTHRQGLGGVRIYVRSGAGWSLSQEIPNPSLYRLGGTFGTLLAVDGDGGRLAIADSRIQTVGEPTHSDRILIYDRQASGTWTLTTTLTPGGGEIPLDARGAMTFDRAGETLLVGAANAADFQGAAYFYASSSTGWTQSLVAQADDLADSFRFGKHVAISADGSTALITESHRMHLSGTKPDVVEVYTKSAGVWSRTATLAAPDGLATYGLNGDVAINGDGTVAVATVGFTGLAGRNIAGLGLVFTRSGSTWAQQSTFLLNTSVLQSSLEFNGRTLVYAPGEEGISDLGLGASLVRVYDMVPGIPVVEQPRDQPGAVVGRPIVITASAGLAGLSASWQVSFDNGLTWSKAGAGGTTSINGETRAWLSTLAPAVPALPSGYSGPDPLYRVTFIDQSSGVTGTSIPVAAPVYKAAAQVSIEVASNPILVGDTAVVRVRVDSPVPGLSVTGGVVQLSVGTAWQLSAPVNSGVATFTVPSNLAAGGYLLQANYQGTPFAWSQARDATLYVERRAVTISGEFPATVRIGDSATYTAVLTPVGAPFAPTGGVLFLSGGQPIGFSQVSRAADGRFTATLRIERTTTLGDSYTQLVYLGGPQAYAATSGVYRVSVATGNEIGGLAQAITAAPAASPIVPATTPPSSPSAATYSGRVYGEGETATFTIPSRTEWTAIQWQVSRDGGMTWADVPGAVDPWFRVKVAQGDDGSHYRARLTSTAGGTATTAPETLTVVPWTTRVQISGTFGAPWVVPQGRDVQLWVAVTRPGDTYWDKSGTVVLTIGNYTAMGALDYYGNAYLTVPAAVVSLGLNRVQAVYNGSDPKSAESVFMVSRQASSLSAQIPATASAGGLLSYSVEASVQTGDFAPKGGVIVLANGQPIAFYQLIPGADRSRKDIKTALGLPPGDVYLQFVYLGEPRATMASSGVYKVSLPPRSTALSASSAVAVAPPAAIAPASAAPIAAVTASPTWKPVRSTWTGRMRVVSPASSRLVKQGASPSPRRMASLATIDQRYSTPIRRRYSS